MGTVFDMFPWLVCPPVAAFPTRPTIQVDSNLPTPIGYWTLDETGGTRVGTYGARDLEVVGTVGYSTGKVGNAVHLGGTDIGSLGPASMGSPTYLVGANVLYVAGWFYAASLQNSNQGSLVLAIHGEEFPYYSVIPSFDGVNLKLDLAVTMSEGMGGYIQSPALSAGTWYFWETYVNPPANEIGIRLNRGSWATSTAGDTTFGANIAEAVYGPASNPSGYGDDYLHDGIGLYGHMLTDAESEALYNSGLGAQP